MKISRAPLGLIFAAVLALVATDVMAQRPGGRGGDRGGRGGGPGGGGPGGRGFGGGGFGGGGFTRGGGGLTTLLRNEKVREEIELMPDQEDALQKIAENMPRPERPSFDFRDRSEENRAKMEEWMAKMRKDREEAQAKVKEQLEEVLLPEQMDRLNEIYVQSQGIAALMSADVVKELSISDDQQAEMKEVMEARGQEMRSKMQEMFQGGGGFQDGMREKIREIMTAGQKETEEKVLGVLTSDQKKGYEKMKGEPFEGLDQLRGGGRGDRGRGGPGGDRGRGGDRGGRGGDRGGRPEIDDI